MSEFLAEAQVLIRPNTTQFRAELETALRAATAKPLVVPVTVAPVGTGTLSAATAGATGAAAANRDLTDEQIRGAKATKELNRQLAEQARQMGQVEKAAIANTAGMLGLRGAVLTAGTAFLGATIAFQAASKAIGAASDTTEELNKNVEVFGKSAQTVRDFAETSAKSLGISNLEALRAAATFGNLFRAINIAAPAAAEMSTRLVQLASDLASFNNADPTLVLQNLRSGLAGEAEPLRKFGIFLSEARVQQEALIISGKESVKQLTQSEKVQARFNLILQDSVIAQGDFARTSDSLANQTRILNAELQNLGAQLGTAIIPPLRIAIGLALEYVDAISQAASVTKDLANAIPGLGAEIPGTNTRFESLVKNLASFSARNIALGPVLGTTSFLIKKLGDESDDAAEKLPRLADTLDAAGRAAAGAAAAIVAAQKSIQSVSQSLNALEVAQLKIQTGLEGGGRAAEEENLKRQIEADRRLIEETKSGTEARRQALIDLKADQDALAALQEQDAQDAKTRADDVRRASEDAARAQQEADQAFVDALSIRREDLGNAIAAATAAGSTLHQQIAAQDRLQSLIKAQIRKIRQQVQDEELRATAIRELRQALNRSRAEEQALREQQRQARAARQDEIQQLNIDIALERGNEAAARRAILARIKSLNAQIKAAKGDQVKVKQLILERERLRNQLEDLNEEQKKTSDISKEVFFDFLQRQQGFAANLLGNLIPGAATAGLVGGQQAGLQQAITPPSRALTEAAAVTQVQGRGLTQGQGDTQIAVLRQIRDALFQLTGRTAAPEARYQRATQSAFMDVIGT